VETGIPSVLAAGTILQEYEIVQVLGRPGGLDITYLATDTHLAKKVAIKEYLPTEFALRLGDATVSVRSKADREAFDRGRKAFLVEAKVLARFSHPNLVQVYRYFEANGTAYIVMEFVEGETLLEKLRETGAFGEERLLGILISILDGLELVHKAGLLHRNVKSENILLRPDGSPVLIDFGAARNALSSASKSVMTTLTAGYAPIEQYSEADQQGPWTDLYALGAVAYRVIAGKKPPDAISRLRSDPVSDILNLSQGIYSDRLLRAVEWALAIEAGKRPQSAAQWREALRGNIEPASLLPTSDDTTLIFRPGTILPGTAGGNFSAGVPKTDADQPTRIILPQPTPNPVSRRLKLNAEVSQGRERSSTLRFLLPLALILGFGTLAAGIAYLLARQDDQVVIQAPTKTQPASVVAAVSSTSKPQAESPAQIIAPAMIEAPRSSDAAPKAAETPKVEDAAEVTYWNGIQGNTDPAAFSEYLRRWPKGRFVEAARNQAKALNEKQVAESNKAALAAVPAASAPKPEPATAAAPVTPAPVITRPAEPLASRNVESPPAPVAPPAPAAIPLPAPEKLRQVQAFRDCPECPEMVTLAAPDTFRMGSPADEGQRGNDESPQHPVTMQRSFSIGRYEVSFDQWEQCIAAGGCASRPNDRGWGRGKRPVINVTLDDATTYTRWLSKKTGRKYRLPSEAEWEYAARAASSGPAYWGNALSLACRYANGPDLSYAKDQNPSINAVQCTDGFAATAPVGSFVPNAFGLYDMLGNVWEWTSDCYHDNYSGAPADGSAWGDASCGNVAVRGGSFAGDAYDLRAANRLKNTPASRRFSVGFRVVRSD
jgi:formylglycine-generating enzyme required for sulfatase activity/serine/threonine protein kinase